MATKKLSFGLMDIPLSCSLFMEPALERHKQYASPISTFTAEYVHEWNIALLDIMKLPCIKNHLGEVGNKILNGSIRSDRYLARCVEGGANVPMHSLHYALRFSESARFLSGKIAGDSGHCFVDLGAGLSPLAAAIQTEYNISGAYIIDDPVIMEAYIRTAELVGGRVPIPTTWNDAKEMSMSHAMDTVVAMGVLHYMPLDEQIERMRFINSHVPNFLLEIKYNTGKVKDEHSFDLTQLQSLRLLVNNTQTLETTMIQNSLRYLSRFIHAMPNQRSYLEKSRSLFLSR